LFRLNIGSNGNVTNLLNITDNSSTLFRVSETQIESAIPHAFTAAGDVSIAYDLIFTNQTASTIDSYGPLTIRAGESFESNNLTLATYNSGQVVINGSLNGTTVVSNTTSTAAGTVTVSGRGVIYYLHDDSGTTDSSYTTTINVTGVPTREGTIIFIRSGCQKGATTNSQTHTCVIQINGTQISSVATATGTGASTVLENYIAVYLNSGWRIITGTGTSDSADIAEVFKAETDVDAGEVVSLVTGQDLKVKRAIESDANKIIGITSTKPAVVLGEEEFDIETRKISVALAGRVPVKIDPSSETIFQGDFIGASQTPGKAKKVKAGLAIGRALEDWSPNSGKDKILVFVNNPTFVPDFQLTSSGNLNIAQDNQNQGFFQITDNQGNLIDKLSGFTKIISENIKAGFLDVGELLAETLKVKEIKPKEDEIAIKLEAENEFEKAKLTIKNKFSQNVAEIDEQGNASFSGTLSSQNLSTENATISGELRVGKILADQIISEKGVFADATANTYTGISREEVEALLREAENQQNLLSQSNNWNINTATGSATLNELILENLYVSKTAAVESLSLTRSLVIGNDLVLSQITNTDSQIISNNIDSLNAPLSIQASASQPLYLMAGLIQIDTQGNVQIAGNLLVGGEISTTKLSLKKTPNKNTTQEKVFSILDETGKEQASISASGSAQFKDLSISLMEIEDDPNATSSATTNKIVYESQASAGSAVIPVGFSEITIKNPKIDNQTLVFITPTSPLGTFSLYVKEQRSGEVKIGFSQPTESDISFNWWIVKLAKQASAE